MNDIDMNMCLYEESNQILDRLNDDDWTTPQERMTPAARKLLLERHAVVVALLNRPPPEVQETELELVDPVQENDS